MKPSIEPNDTCRICGGDSPFLFSQVVLDNSIKYYQCSCCGYTQTEMPYWLDKAYEDAINLSDCGILVRNERTRKWLVVALARMGLLHGKVLDCAGGYGILVRMLRDWGIDAYWNDPYCKNLVARGFETQLDKAQFDIVTAFEVLEHMVNPVEEIKKLFTYADTLICSTALISMPAPSPGRWWYYAFEHGQHVGFFTKPSLKVLAEKLGVYLATDGKSNHILSRKKRISNTQMKFLRNLKFTAPVIAKIRLKSKTWEDHNSFSSGRYKK